MYEMYQYQEEPEPDTSEARAALQEALDRRDNGGVPTRPSKVAAWQR